MARNSQEFNARIIPTLPPTPKQSTHCPAPNRTDSDYLEYFSQPELHFAAGKSSSFSNGAASMFCDREVAAEQLAEILRKLALRDPVILAIPRGGLVVGVSLSKQLGIGCGVLLSRKLQIPEFPDALGAVAEGEALFINRRARGIESITAETLAAEKARQFQQLEHARIMYLELTSPPSIAQRSVIVADDGLLTGSTMAAALDSLRGRNPYELIAAVPFANAKSVTVVARRCGRLICLQEGDEHDVREHLRQLDRVTEADATRLLRERLSR